MLKEKEKMSTPCINQELLERIEQCPDIQHLQHIVQVLFSLFNSIQYFKGTIHGIP